MSQVLCSCTSIKAIELGVPPASTRVPCQWRAMAEPSSFRAARRGHLTCGMSSRWGTSPRGTPTPARTTPRASPPPARPSTPPPPPRRTTRASTPPSARRRRRHCRRNHAVPANVRDKLCDDWMGAAESLGMDGGAYILDLFPHVRRRELAGAGLAHREGRADGDTDVVRLLGCDRERRRRAPVRRPALVLPSQESQFAEVQQCSSAKMRR